MSTIDSIIDKLASTTVEDENEVSFAGRGLKLDSEEDASEIVEAIRACPAMTSLTLEGNTIGVPAAKAIAKALESQPNFHKALWKDMFTQRTEHEIPDALNFLSSGIILAKAHLVELDLSDNAFGPRGLKGIVKLLQSEPCYTLKELRLNNNGLGISGAKMLADALLQCLHNSEKDGKRLCLKQFICGRNRLENEGSLAISVFFKAAGTLEYIAMPQNGIYYVGIEGLANAFAKNPSLKVLNLEDNSITASGARFIAEALPSLEALEVINFGDCLLRGEGAKIIAESLKTSCPHLKELWLGYNEISKEGGLAIVDSLVNKPLLEKLAFNGNQFGSEGCEMVRIALENINKPQILDSLSEDESSDEEGEEEDDQNSDPDHSGEDEETPEQDDSYHISPLNKFVTFADFLGNQSEHSLLQLHRSKTSILPQVLPNPSVTDYLDLFLKISSVVTMDSSEEVEMAAAYYGDELLSAAFTLFTNDDIWKFNNSFLVSLNLIKTEEKEYAKKLELTGALIVLKHCVGKSYFQNSTRDLLKLILTRPLRYANAHPTVVATLMQKLFH